MHRPSETVFVDGPVGPLQTLVDDPEVLRGLALVAHPHPLFGGTNQNKVVYTLAHTLRDLGYVALRPNFRGVGKSPGIHDHGDGETEDLLAVLGYATKRWDPLAMLPIVLAGFSFGAFVQTRVAKRLVDDGRPAQRMVLVGLPAGLAGNWPYQPEPIPSNSLLIHGNCDEVVPLDHVRAYAEPLGLSVSVIPDADHFFHGRLQMLRDIIERNWQ
jgi:alpha/beta superfamily hydrolase